MNLWDYETLNVVITDKKGSKTSGCIIAVISAEDWDIEEDGLTLESEDGRLYGFRESEIASIDIV